MLNGIFQDVQIDVLCIEDERHVASDTDSPNERLP